MALRTPPSWLQNGSHPAENDRLTTTGILWKSQGISDYGSMQVSQSATPAMTVSVAAGHALIAGTQTSNQGFYIAYNDAATTVAIATASPTLPRLDRIVVTVQDSFYGGTANNQVIFQALTGTPNASPVAPATPANSISLAIIAVAANQTTVVNGNITDTRSTAQLSENSFTAQATAANTLTINGIVGQTGRALRINDNTGTQKFAVSVDGTLTFQDGTTQTTAATYDPNLIINTQTGTTYTVVAGDAQKIITLSNASPITLTIASNATQALPVGTQVTISQYGAGQVTVVGASSPVAVTVVSTGATSNQPKLRVQYSTATLIQTSTDNWLVVGDIS
jgi:hypothetical protein